MLGRLNPKTGKLKEIETRKKPYGIKVGKSGDLFIAYNGTNAIGRMHPDTLSVLYYDIPDTATRIRRLDIDSDQNVWFVNSSLGKVGRLDVDTGEVTQWNSPSGPTSHPYSMTVINDIVWYTTRVVCGQTPLYVSILPQNNFKAGQCPPVSALFVTRGRHKRATS